MNILFIIILLLVILLIIILFYFYKKKNIEFFKENKNTNKNKDKDKRNPKKNKNKDKDKDKENLLSSDVLYMLSRKYLKEVNGEKIQKEKFATLAKLLSNNNYFI